MRLFSKVQRARLEKALGELFHLREEGLCDALEPCNMLAWPYVLGVGWNRTIIGVRPTALPKFLEIGSRVVLGVFNAEGSVSPLMADIGLKVGSFRRLVKVKKCIALCVGLVDQFAGDAVVRQCEKSDFFERITNVLDKSIPLFLAVGKRKPVVHRRNASCHASIIP